MSNFNHELFAGAVRIHRGSTPTAEVAAATHLSRPTLLRMERGLNTPRADTFLALCVWMGRNPMDFAIPMHAPAGSRQRLAVLQGFVEDCAK